MPISFEATYSAIIRSIVLSCLIQQSMDSILTPDTKVDWTGFPNEVEGILLQNDDDVSFEEEEENDDDSIIED